MSVSVRLSSEKFGPLHLEDDREFSSAVLVPGAGPWESNAGRPKRFLQADCIGGGSIAVRQRKSISAGFFASVNRRVERKQTFPNACAGGAYSAGRPDSRQLLIYVAERLEIPCFESKHAFHESQTFTRYENRFEEMLHPFAERDSIANTSSRNGCFESIGIRKRAHWKKRIRELQSADELKRFHRSSSIRQ